MITESHKAVGKMYIFNCNIWVIRSNIIMTEIPKSFYTEFNKLINNFFCIIAWYAKHCNGRGVVATKIIQTVNMSYGYVTYKLACKCFVFIKNTNEVKPACFKRHMRSYGVTEISCTY